MARDIVIEERPAVIVGRSSFITSTVIGAVVGFVGWLLMLGIYHWVLNPVFCRSADTATACANSGLTSWIIAFAIMSVVGLFMLIRANVFRPLLIVVAAFVTLWALGLWFLPLVWWLGLIWNTILFALAYALYAWLASADRFIFALIAIVVLVIIMRLVASL